MRIKLEGKQTNTTKNKTYHSRNSSKI